MPRENFISDNLVNMRERFKQNYAERHAPPPEEPAVPPAVPAPVPEAAVAFRPAAPAAPRDGDVERLRRDLDGRLNRDLAAVAAALELETMRRAELERFQTRLQEFAGRFADAGDARSLEHLRIEYFQAYGRASALAFGDGRAPADGGGADAAPRRDWITPAAVLGAALLLCLTLLVLFL